jgi:tRNA U34 5-methylaminomethyl-2-thiouridine-forming methyltransferase MnmC
LYQNQHFMNFKKEKYITSDGSHTFYMPEINEYYHSHHGAIQEALHVFIKNGLHQFVDHKEITIFEVGFGTGFNTLLTCLESEKSKLKINYIGLEAFPLEVDEYADLNFATSIEDKNASVYFEKIHSANWEEKTTISDNFSILKLKNTLENVVLAENSLDLIYFDAFGPRVQPEMWTIELFQKLYDALKTGGVFVTYCAKGQVKRDLKSVGFALETLAGPPGKREMIRCHKN